MILVKSPSILVVIVNYRTADLVLKCLSSLAQERGENPNLQVAVIDNDSHDGSFDRMTAGVAEMKWESWVRIIPADKNLGFGAGNNFILRENLGQEQPADFYFILNPDTEVHLGALRSLLAFFEANPQASILGPCTESSPGVIENSAFRFPSLISELLKGLRLGFMDRIFATSVVAPPPQPKAHICDWISGGAMFLRHEVLEVVGLFDEYFFLYYEEIDFCKRAAGHGFQTWYVPEANILHWAGMSTGMYSEDRFTRPMPRCWFDSRRYYLRKHHSRAYLFLCDLAFIFGRSIWQLRTWIERRKPVDPPHFLWDFTCFNLFGERWGSG